MFRFSGDNYVLGFATTIFLAFLARGNSVIPADFPNLKSCNQSDCCLFSKNKEYDPAHNVPTPTCDDNKTQFNKTQFIFPDVMYSFGGNVFYVTKKDGYVIYKFTDGNMTSFGDPPSERIKTAWNLCTSDQKNDVMTFASSFNDRFLFVYFERPDEMLKITFTPKPTWTEVPRDRYEHCVAKATPKLDKTSYTAMRQVFSVNEPSVVLLLANDNMTRCEWRDGVLIFINTTKSPYGTCPSGRLHFIDRANKYYQIGIPKLAGKRKPPKSNNVVRSAVLAVNDNPVLAFPMLGYYNLNEKSLVKIHAVKPGTGAKDSCEVDGTRTRIYQLYDGNQLDDVIRWLNRSREGGAWLQFHDVNMRRSSFCETVENVSCCDVIVRQFLAAEIKQNVTESGDGKCRNEMFFVSCKIAFERRQQRNSETCPTVSCAQGDVDNDFLMGGETVVCEIPLGNDPPCFVSLDEILKSPGSEKGVKYKDVTEAMQKMDVIAATINYQSKNDTKVLYTLVDSVKALENVNYTSLSRSGAENLISDVVNVVDNIVDDERADVWVTLQEEEQEQEHGYAEKNPSGSNKTSSPVKKSAPSDMLFTLEAILGGIVSGQVWDDEISGETSNFTMAFKTKNIHSTIRKLDVDGGELDAEDNFLKFDCAGTRSNNRPLTIVSKYPKVMQLISQVEKAKKGQLQDCLEEECSEEELSKTEYVKTSPVISATVMERGEKISSSVTFVIPYTDEDIPDPRKRDSKFYFSCRYLSAEGKSESKWDESGCKVTKVDRIKKLVHCFCNHTTNFAILLQVVPPKINKEDMENLQVISYVGESISVFCLIVTLTTFIIFRRSLKSARMVAHFHLVLALIIFHTTQLLVIFAEKEKNSNVVPCIVVTILTHFSLLASFCWMLCEGILLHMSVISVFHSMKYMKVVRYLLGWVVPAFITGITIASGLTRNPYPTCYLEGVGDMSCPEISDDSNLNSTNSAMAGNTDAQPDVQIVQWCWLSTSNYLVWAMAAPALIAVLVNTVILTRVSWVIAQTAKSANMYRPTTEQKKDKHMRKCLKGAMLLMPILGVPWIFGFIPQAASHVGLLYAFTILNSLQGFFILLFYCILSSEVRSAFNRCVRKRNMLYSQNWSTNMSGRHSTYPYAECKTGSRRSVCSGDTMKSRTVSATELIKRDSKKSVNISEVLPSSTTCAGKYVEDDVCNERSSNSNATKQLLRSESSF